MSALPSSLAGAPPRHALHSAMLDVVLAGGSLERVAELAADDVGGTVAVVVPPAGVAVAWPPQPDSALAALRRYAGQRLGGEPAAVPDGLTLELPVVSGRDEVGLVALLGSERTDAIDVLHLAATTTVVALALDGPSPNVAAALVEDLVDGADVPEVEILARARRAGADLSLGAIAAGARPRDLPHRAEAAIREAFPDALILRRDDGIHALLPGPVTDAALRLADRLPAFALAPFEADPERLGAALREAALAAEAVEAGATTAADALGGSFRLLVRLACEQPGELRRFAASTVGAITDDAVVETLEAYFEHDCNMNATAAAIFAHRHTVAYRLERVRDLTGLSPFKQADRERLGLGLKARALL
jgi:PucR family transcriptional regulator, purine catabolism regulatory protein